MAYSVVFERRAEKELASLQPRDRARLLHAIESLAEEPRPLGVKKLKGETIDIWRIRVGSNRVLYTIEDDRLTVVVVRIGHRKEVYRQTPILAVEFGS